LFGKKAAERNRKMEWIQVVAFRFDVELDKNGDNSLNREEILGWIVPSNQDIATEEVSLLYQRRASKRCNGQVVLDLLK
jgi:hypothetical protein